MSYTCPVCDKNTSFFDEDQFDVLCDVLCEHDIGKYYIITFSDGAVGVYLYPITIRSSRILRLKSPKRLDEEYIDMMLLLK